MTPQELILWEELRHSKSGAKFRRQHPISRFIVDFYCHQHKLVIEIDGKIHIKPEVKAHDNERENELKALGLIILRFKNEEIDNHLERVLEEIKSKIKSVQGTPL